MRTAALALLVCAAAQAQQVGVQFSCSQTRHEDERVIYADHGEIRLAGERIEAFRWESALYRTSHGFDCSIDEDDGLEAELIGDEAWRVRLTDARSAREKRGYDFDRGLNCTIRITREGDALQLQPSCPALCGSRNNFSALTVDMKTGNCRYEE